MHDAAMTSYELPVAGRVVTAGDKVSMAEVLDLVQLQGGTRPLYPVAVWQRDGQGEFLLTATVTPQDVLQNCLSSTNLVVTNEAALRHEDDMVVPVPLDDGHVLLKPLLHATAEDVMASACWEVRMWGGVSGHA